VSSISGSGGSRRWVREGPMLLGTYLEVAVVVVVVMTFMGTPSNPFVTTDMFWEVWTLLKRGEEVFPLLFSFIRFCGSSDRFLRLRVVVVVVVIIMMMVVMVVDNRKTIRS